MSVKSKQQKSSSPSSKSHFRKILVANRGEIAIRILRSARELGYQTVAVYSEEDAKAAHRFEADESVCIGPAASRESYLSVPNLLSACRQTKADAVHPGYGFLSENADFARAIEKEKIRFIGPTSQMIDQMGDKVRARSTVQKNKVPTVPGTGAITSTEEGMKEVEALLKARKDFRFPLLVKASGGGGGKGMRIVHKKEELRENLERAQSEALKAFNNATVFVERYIENPRHIEVQVLGDGQNLIHLFERECSLQRRHQKVVEEALSPSLDEKTRAAILKAGVQAAAAIHYESAGTVEFIVSKENDFYFLEMNTRIQVEHPVTEAITGVDLVDEQIRIAAGEKFSLKQADIVPKGHAIEVRLYAEDADNGFLPQPGELKHLRFPQWKGIRVDSSVVGASKISSFYDPMIAKVISYAPTRENAAQKLHLYLKATQIEGIVTNRAFLIDILKSDFFQKGFYHTHLLESSGWRKPNVASAEVMAAFCLKDFLSSQLSFEDRKLSSWQEGMNSRALAP